MRPNPAWADKILYANWRKIAKFAEGRLPMPDPKLSAARKVQWVEYGCGNWGCTYPTESEEVVCKLTSDPTEVRAVVDIAELPKSADLEGIVEYYAVLPLSGRHVAENEKKSTPTHLIWREAAQCHGNLELAAKQAKKKATSTGKGMEEANRIDATWQLLLNQQVCAYYLKSLHSIRKHPATWLKEVVSHLDQGRRDAYADRDTLTKLVKDKFYKTRSRVLEPEGSHAEQAAYLWGAFELLGSEIESLGVIPEVSKTMLSLLEHGVLLADVHDANICPVTRDNQPLYAIIDPGNALLLGSSRRPAVSVPYFWGVG